MHTRAERRHYHEARVRRLYRRWKMFENRGFHEFWISKYGEELPSYMRFNYHKQMSLRFPFHGHPNRAYKVGWRREARARYRNQMASLQDPDEFQFFKFKKITSIYDWY